MVHGDPQHQQHYPQQQMQHQQNQPQPPGGDFYRGPPPQPSPMMRQPSTSWTTLNPQDYRYSSAPGPPSHPYDVKTSISDSHKIAFLVVMIGGIAVVAAHGDSLGAKRMRKLTQRKAVDYTSTVVRYMQIRMWQRDSRDRTVLQFTPAVAIDMLPTVAYSDNPSTSFAAKFVHTSGNKNCCPINRVLWTPNGRRLITGSQNGEFTLWNGQSFNFEMIIQAHDQAIRSMVWSHNDNWMVSGDDGGAIKYWQSNMNNVKANKSGHKESVCDLSFCRTDLNFCSCSDDTTVKVWDFARCQEERSLTGGKDNLVKLRDAKSGRELCSFHGHKNTVLCVKWNQNGNWVITSSKDQIIKLYDIRTLKELKSFRGHQKDVTALAWHPFHEEYFVSGSFDGCLFHWLVGHETPQIEVPNAHDNIVWDLAWHPIGYLLCSGGNDHTTKFWCRNRPGDTARDNFNMGQNQGYGEQSPALAGRFPSSFPVPEQPATPGPFPPGLSQNEGTIPGVGAAMPLSVPSLEASAHGEQKQPLPMSMPFRAPPLPPGSHPSLLTANQQQGFLQNSQQMAQQQHQVLPLQMPPLPMLPPNMQQLQPPSQMSLLHHPHLPRPPPQVRPHGMPSLIPSPMPSSLQAPSAMPTPVPLPMPGPMGMQGTMNRMAPPLPQGHFMGQNPMHPGSLQASAAPSTGGFPSGMPNVQGPSNATGAQMFPQGVPFNQSQGGQMPMIPGFNPYQSGNQPGMPPPLPPGPPLHSQQPQ